MIYEKKQPIGGINTDDSERLLELSDYVNMENMRIGGSEGGRTGRAENIPGTTLVYTNPFLGVNTTIQRCKDESKQRLFSFNYNSNGDHNIMCYDEAVGLTYIVLANATVEGGLNFILDGFLDCFFVNDCIYFTDRNNEPRKVNVERGILFYQPTYVTTKLPYKSPIKQVHISWLRKPPILPPTFIKRQSSVNSVYSLRGTWYWFTFLTGQHGDVLMGGYILRITSPTSETYYAGTTFRVNGNTYRFDLYSINNINNPANPPSGLAALPTTIDVRTLPTLTSFSTLAELENYYADGPTKPDLYPHRIVNFDIVGPPVLLTNFIVPSTSNPNNFIRYEAMQFCWRYTYWDYETSVLSTFSESANYNFKSEAFDIIDIGLPFDETIEPDVYQVDLVVRYIVGDSFFIIKSWKNTIDTDGAAILDHNNRTTALAFSYDNSFRGIALDKAYVAKPFDSIPLQAGTCTIGKNRAYMGETRFGYFAPKSTSLAFQLKSNTVNVITGSWYFIKYNNGTSTKYFINTPNGFCTAPTDPPPFPATLDVSTLVVVALGFGGLASYLSGNISYPNQTGGIQSTTNTTVLTNNSSAPPSLANTRALKSDAAYKGCITFFDYGIRRCGIVTNDSLLMKTKERKYLEDTFQTGFDWTLDPNTAVQQIPDWATHYTIDITRCLRTRYFLQMRNKKARYVSKDVNGLYTFTNTAYADGLLGCALDISILLQRGMGYTYSAGSNDIIKIWLANEQKFNLKVIGSVGNYILTELQNLGTLDDTTAFLFEIYTPHTRSDSEPFYEVGQVFKVLNPGTSARAFSVAAGSIKGDVNLLNIVLATDTYIAEAMSPNDQLFQNWITDAGRADNKDTIGQVELQSAIPFSDKLLPETRVNGLSSFDALNISNTFVENGKIQKLILADKQEEDGSVMLAICMHATVSIYLGETQLISNAGDAFIAQAVGVIGTINSLKGSNGTFHPESVYEYLGQVKWFDIQNGDFVRYADNGVYSISDLKANRYFSRYSRRYMTDGAAAVKARSGFSKINVCVDPNNKEILVTMPAPENAGYAGLLPGFDNNAIPPYTDSIDNRYVFYDGKAKTVIFKIDDKRWAGSFGFVSDLMEYMGMNLYGFKNGNLYKHNSDRVNYNTFYGVRYPQRICLVANVGPSEIRVLENISVEGNAAPTFTHAYSKYPNIQSTDLLATDYKNEEGVFYAAFKNDRLSPGFPAQVTAKQKRTKGKKIRSATPFIMVEFTVYDKLLNVDFINIGYRESSGHKV